MKNCCTRTWSWQSIMANVLMTIVIVQVKTPNYSFINKILLLPLTFQSKKDCFYFYNPAIIGYNLLSNINKHCLQQSRFKNQKINDFIERITFYECRLHFSSLLPVTNINLTGYSHKSQQMCRFAPFPQRFFDQLNFYFLISKHVCYFRHFG